MREGMLHIRDVEGPKKTGSMETRLEAMEQQVFKCQGMVERGLNANHMMITEFTNKHRIDANDIGKHLSRLYDRVDQLQGQIYDLQNQNSQGTNPPRIRRHAENQPRLPRPAAQLRAIQRLPHGRAWKAAVVRVRRIRSPPGGGLALARTVRDLRLNRKYTSGALRIA
ncbi:40S ribosomal protein S5-1 [Hordeum vulgare]|nr:40S ribosomal protein S5-1 [Hordeum vulgare]